MAHVSMCGNLAGSSAEPGSETMEKQRCQENTGRPGYLLKSLRLIRNERKVFLVKKVYGRKNKNHYKHGSLGQIMVGYLGFLTKLV